MIAVVRGLVRGKIGSKALIVETQGIGYLIYASLEVVIGARIDSELELWCVTVVREDSLTLFGFVTLGERNLFEALIGVRLIGPALAQMIVSTLRVEDLIEAVETNETAMLRGVPGIGEKTANRILVELSSKLAVIRAAVGEDAIGNTRRINLSTNTRRDVESALMALGFDSREIHSVLSLVPAGLTVEQALKAALVELSS